MFGRMLGGVLGRAIGREKGNHPIAGTIIGAGAMMAARRLLPQRYAVLGATVAAAYLTKRWAERAEERQRMREAEALQYEGMVDPYAGTAGIPDGEKIADALPPSIPASGNGKQPRAH